LESVRFTDATIGIGTDTTMIDLGATAGMVTVNGDLKATGDLTLSKAAAAITHGGGTSLSISSTTGFVAVEAVQFAGSQIGIGADTTMIDLGATAGMVTVNGDLKATGDLTLSKAAAVITHSGGTSLSISSGGYVAVESVQFAGANIGISADTNLMVLTSGTLTVDGKVASTTLDVTGATTLDSATVTGAASFGGEFSAAYAAVSASGGTATCTDAKSVCVVTGAGGASDGAWTVAYGGNSPATGTMVFVRNGSGVDTASTAFGTGTQILKNTGALFVYSGSAWTRII